MKKIILALLLISSVSFGHTLESGEILVLYDTIGVGQTKETLFEELTYLIYKEDNDRHIGYLFNIFKMALRSDNLYVIDVEIEVIYIFLKFEEDDPWMLL